MSCSCGVVKVNVQKAGVFALSDLALGKSEKKTVLYDAAVFGGSGVVYDEWLYTPMEGVDPLMMKSAYQVGILEGYKLAMGRKFSVRKLMMCATNVLIANYGVDMLDSLISSGKLL